jgi:hypothetical protein
LAAQTFEIGDFASIVETPGQPRTWIPAQFPAPEGGMWVYQEPDAVIVVQDGRLRVAAVPFTRGHDRVQVLDNAKHMYFSTRTFEAAERGRLTVEWEMAASISRGKPGDLYDGFVSFHLLNPAGGVAVDVFLGNEELATVYARLPFPGSNPPRPAKGPRFYSVFDEVKGRTRPGELHAYAMIHDRGARTLEWRMDGEAIKRLEEVDDIGPCHLVMGLMTEKDIVNGKSVSCHGQGAVGTWGRIRVTLEEAAGAEGTAAESGAASRARAAAAARERA